MHRTYLHYPFCLTLCRYCNFAAGAPPKEEFIEPYQKALLQEINFYKNQFDFDTIACDSFYLGGGTPSLMPQKDMEQIFRIIPVHSNTEVTLEINPETVTKEKAKFWKDIGINRVSLGWQSMNADILAFLGRSGTTHDNRKAFAILREEGFDNISVDRILSVRGDSDESFFEAIKEDNPDHISTYQLTIEKRTVLEHWTKNKQYLPVSDEKAIALETMTELKLSDLGFERYETSNYHKNNKKGRHNLGYWDYEHWLGLGAGAAGFIPNENYGFRYRNHFSFKDYINDPFTKEESETIDKQTAIREALMLGIRKIDGINKESFAQKFHMNWKELFPKGTPTEYFEETDSNLFLKKEMIPLTNPATIALWGEICTTN